MPSFGRYPKIVLDQQRALDDYISSILDEDAKYQTSLIYGLRGAGKTVFLLNIEHTLKDIKNWEFIRLNLGQGNLLFQLLQKLREIAGVSLKDALRSIQGINILVNGINLQSIQSSGMIDYEQVLDELLTRIEKKGKSILIGIDEIEISDDIRSFGSVYQTLIGEEHRINLVMTGLPSRISEVQNDKILTFLLRSNRIYLSPLDEDSVRRSYELAFERGKRKIDPLASDQLSQAVQGYAYAFQTLGYYAWKLSEKDQYVDEQVVEQAIELSKEDLFRNAYEKMYIDLSERDREFIDAIVNQGVSDVSVNSIAKKMNKEKNYISMYRSRLIDDQLIAPVKHGYVKLTLPFFRDFVIKYRKEHFI